MHPSRKSHYFFSFRHSEYHHAFPRMIALMVVLLIPNISESSSCRYSPESHNFLIFFTSSIDTILFEFPCFRLRKTLSLALSSAVPSLRCFGFTHLGLSHPCKTHNPFGIS